MTSEQTLHDVARVYMASAATDGAPAKAIRARLGLSARSADKYIRQAKDAGLIPARVARNNRKIVAVAERLGVDPDDLRRAVLEVAGGDLRVIRVEANR